MRLNTDMRLSTDMRLNTDMRLKCNETDPRLNTERKCNETVDEEFKCLKQIGRGSFANVYLFENTVPVESIDFGSLINLKKTMNLNFSL